MARLPWVKLHRSMLEWEWYGSKEARLLFLHLILSAHDGEWRHMGAAMPPGTLVTTYAELAAEVGISTRTVARLMGLFTRSGEVSEEPDPVHIGQGRPKTLITLNNWDDRQKRKPSPNGAGNDAGNSAGNYPVEGEELNPEKTGAGKQIMQVITQDTMQVNTQENTYLISNNKENLEIERDREGELSPPLQAQNDFRYPTTAKEVIQAAEAQCIKLTETDALIFLDNYRSKGWMVGGSRITDWKARIRLFMESRKQITHQNKGATQNDNSELIRGGHVVGHDGDFLNDPLVKAYPGT